MLEWRMSWFSKLFRRKKKEEEVGGEPTLKPSSIQDHDSPKDSLDKERMTFQEEEQFIEKAARKIIKHGFETPAIMFLATSKPLASIGGQFFYMLSPFIAPFGFEQTSLKYKNFLEKQENLERLITRIEELAESKK